MRSALLALLLAVLLPGSAGSAHAGAFALLGDIPYNHGEIEALRGIIDEINRDDEIAFVVHDGDFKSGSERCDDQRFLDRKADFEASRHPFIFIPGDNEWTDCHRANNGGYDPEERLAKLRELFFAGSTSLGKRALTLTRQGDLQPQYAAWRENVRWEQEGVLFVGLNIPGSNNNWKPRGDNDEFQQRLKATTAWISTNFRTARERNLRAVMLILQGNPDFEGTESAKRTSRPGGRDGYAEFKAHIAREARAFGKPVVVVHGDTHSYQLDQPLMDEEGKRVPNVTRLETPGSPFVGWVKVKIKGDADVFQFARRHYLRPTAPP